jgi:hypothetical protein
MSVPIHINTDSILQKCKENKTGVLLIVAPTGTGKTMGMRSLVIRHKNIYGKTIMIQPTNMAKCSIEGICAMTAQQLIHHFLRTHKFDCHTLIIDEIHTLCVEYHTLLSILHKTEYYKKIRVVLMSATPNVNDLENFFPLQVLTTPVISPFSIGIKYEPLEFPGFAPYRHMTRHLLNILKKNPDHKRVLVFLYTHDQCEKMAFEFKEFTALYNNGKTLALYGGMDKNDMDAWHQFLEKEENFIVFSTNVAETSITIPGLSLVVDFGIRCIQRNNRIVYNNCPKSNLIQRAGRTGRTCPGVVIRCMREEDFNNRPDKDFPEYNWDLMVLLILRYKYDPAQLLPENLNINGIIRKFRFYRLMDDEGRLDRDLISFVLKCPLLLKNSCHLYYFLKSNSYTYNPQFILYVISTAIIDHMENRMSRIYYYSYDMKISRYKFFEKLKKIFTERDDELIIYINIILSCILNEKPLDFSNAFSLNFRSIRHISSTIGRLWNFVNHFINRKTEITWQDTARDKLYTKTEMDFDRKNRYNILLLKNCHVEQLRHLHTINPLVPKFLLVNDMIWRPNFIIEYYNCILSPFVQIYNRNRCILLLSYDDNEIDKWFDPSMTLDDIVTLSFSIYTFPPTKMDQFIKSIGDSVKRGYFEMNVFKKRKDLVKKKFRPVLEDILEDVAYRPGFWKMGDSIGQFLDEFSFFLKN